MYLITAYNEFDKVYIYDVNAQLTLNLDTLNLNINLNLIKILNFINTYTNNLNLYCSLAYLKLALYVDLQ